MKAFILFFIIVLLAPVTNLQAQAGSNVIHHSSLPHIYYVRTVNIPGKSPAVSIEVIDKEGRSISCRTDDPKKQSANQLSITDSLINRLENCAECKIVKTNAQMEAIFKSIVLIAPKCSPDSGIEVYGRNHDEGRLYFIQKITIGCGKTDNANKLLDSLISQFEKPGDKSLLKELNNAFVAKQNKPVSDETDLNFVPQINKDSVGTFRISARITTDGMLRLVSKIPLTRVKVVFFPIKTFGRIIHYTGIFFLTKKPGSDLYDLDLNEEEFKKMAKLTIIPTMVTGEKAEITLLHKNAPEQSAASAAQINNPVTDVPSVDFLQVDATFGYSARITPDGILRYKTPAKPVAAAIIFQDPVTGVYPNVDFDPKKERRTYAVKEEKAGEYIIDISKENYNKKPILTLILTNAKGDSAAIKLGNRNVKAAYVHYDKSNFGAHLQQSASKEYKSTVKQWNDAKEHYYVRTVTGNAAQPGGPQTYIFIVNDKGNTLSGGGIGSSIKLPEGGFLRLFGLTDTLLSQLDNCKNCPSARKPAEMDSIAKAAKNFVRTGINYHMPVAGQPAYYLYAKDEYGIMHLIDGKFARGCSIIERDIKAVSDFLDVWDRYEKNGAAITKALEEGSLVIHSADKDFIPRATVAIENTLACTIWIDIAGLVHCKTTNSLFSSDIYFHSPTTTVTEKGITQTIQPEESEKHYIPKKISANEYVMDISKDKYKQMDKITVIVEDRNGKNAMVYLFNKRMQWSK